MGLCTSQWAITGVNSFGSFRRSLVTISFPMLTIIGQTLLFLTRTLDVTMTSL